uniref:Uncharacterized protein n=1 Tax=Cyanidium caldarium TaxID=2771 RepID=Q9TM43_CYACA|nr:hypothetical protein JXY51_pgp005 [Cyanidium caldarium]AAF13022.1 unknown [Cyanidium caldarium]
MTKLKSLLNDKKLTLISCLNKTIYDIN